MPLDFQPRQGSAVDSNSGLTIYAPRMLPASPPENPEHIEYQYPIYLNGQRFDGLGLFGTSSTLETAGRMERIFTLDLGRNWVLDTVLSIKQRLGNEDNAYAFIKDLSSGLVLVFAKDLDHDIAVRYRIVADAHLLEQRDVVIPVGATRSIDGSVVLAEILIARGAGEVDAP